MCGSSEYGEEDARDIKEGVCERMSMSEREKQLTTRVEDLEVELAATRRLYYAMQNERDALLKTSRQKNQEVASLKVELADTRRSYFEKDSCSHV